MGGKKGKRKESQRNISGLEFLQCSIELCRNQSIIHLRVAVLRPCFKKHAKTGMGPEHAASTHFTQKMLTGEIRLSMSISGFFFVFFVAVVV